VDSEPQNGDVSPVSDAPPLEALLAEIEVSLVDVVEKFNLAFGPPQRVLIPAA